MIEVFAYFLNCVKCVNISFLNVQVCICFEINVYIFAHAPLLECYVTVGKFTQRGLSCCTETLGVRVLVSSTKSEEDLESF